MGPSPLIAFGAAPNQHRDRRLEMTDSIFFTWGSYVAFVASYASLYRSKQRIAISIISRRRRLAFKHSASLPGDETFSLTLKLC